MKTVIIDYGSGNLHSAAKAVERAGRDANIVNSTLITDNADQVLNADRIILPGVGAFADCRDGLGAVPDMIEVLEEKVIKKATPFLGICVGTQLMAERGMEKGQTPGLGWIGGDVVEITPDDPELKIPQIGWNTLSLHQDHALFNGLPTGENGWHAYFVHSYHIASTRPEEVIATTDYGGPVTAVIGKDNWVGTQFHPEKSQALGLALIENFLKWKP